MVTETIPVREQEQEVLPVLGVCEVGERIGVPVVIRPWWGSRRQFYLRRHRVCGQRLYYRGEQWCFECKRYISAQEIEHIRAVPGRWVCPAGWSQQLKWPAVEGDKVIMWEGRCGARYEAAQIKRYSSAIHVHRQALEVLDFSATAMLVRVSVNKHSLNFLIGQDDGHPFVHVVTKSQTSVSDAYDYMVPVPVFNAQMHGFDVKRQGDWFFVPREFFHRRPIRNEEKRVRPWPGRMDSAVANSDSGTIFSHAPIELTRHIAGRLIWAWPYELVKGTVTAPDHPPVQLDTWHCAIRNKRPPAYNRDTTSDVD